MLVIGNFITNNVILALPATVCCLPRARVSNIEANVRMLVSGREKQGTQTYTIASFSINVSSNNVRMKQSEITKEGQSSEMFDSGCLIPPIKIGFRIRNNGS